MKSLIGRLLIVASTVGAGCGGSDRTWDLVDTTGQRFQYDCSGSSCSVSVAGDTCGAKGSASGSAILQICSKSSERGIIYIENCRPVACSSDDACRTSFDVAYKCSRGICQRAPSLPLQWADLQILCLADVPRAGLCEGPPFESPRLELAKAACPGDDPYRTCSVVPKECQQL